MSHPHPNRRHIMVCYRRFVLGQKHKFGSARGIAHYLDYVREYLEAKRDVVAGCSCAGHTDIYCPVHGTRATADPALIASVDAFLNDQGGFLDETSYTVTPMGRRRFYGQTIQSQESPDGKL